MPIPRGPLSPRRAGPVELVGLGRRAAHRPMGVAPLRESFQPRHRNDRGPGRTRQDGSKVIDPADGIRSGPGAHSGSGVDARRAELTEDDTPRVSGRGAPGAPGRSDRESRESAGSRSVRADFARSILAMANGDDRARRWDPLGIRSPQIEKSQESGEAPLSMACVPRLPRPMDGPPWSHPSLSPGDN